MRTTVERRRRDRRRRSGSPGLRSDLTASGERLVAVGDALVRSAFAARVSAARAGRASIGGVSDVRLPLRIGGTFRSGLGLDRTISGGLPRASAAMTSLPPDRRHVRAIATYR